MTIYYSKTTGGFYLPGFPVSPPADARAVSAERYAELHAAAAAVGGRRIVGNDDGDPIVIEPPAASAADLRNAALAALAAEYERRVSVIAAPYPAAERESWPIQINEARALLADAAAVTPWIDAAAAARELDRAELAARIVAKDEAYRLVHGALTGVRQRIEDAITAAGDDVAALQAIDVTAGWPA